MFCVKLLMFMLLILFIERWKLLEAKWYGGEHEDVKAKAAGKKTHIQMFDIVKGKAPKGCKSYLQKSDNVVARFTVTTWQQCLMICIKVRFA